MVEITISRGVQYMAGCRRAINPFVEEAVDAGVMFDDLLGDLGHTDAGATVTGEKNKIPIEGVVVGVYVLAVLK